MRSQITTYICSQIATYEFTQRCISSHSRPYQEGHFVIGCLTSHDRRSNCCNFDTARPTVSKHLHILTECELLSQVQDGREIYYKTNVKKMKAVADFIEPFRKMWDDRFNKLETIMKKRHNK